MSQKPNPAPRNGERNLFCPLYDDCLDLAVRKSWPDWHCVACPHRWQEESGFASRFTASNPVDCYELPVEIEH